MHWKNIISIILICGVMSVQALPISTKAYLTEGMTADNVYINKKIFAHAKDPINMREEGVFVPLGSMFSGYITDIHRPNNKWDHGYIIVRFDAIQYPNGSILYINGYLTPQKTTAKYYKKPIENEEKYLWKWRIPQRSEYQKTTMPSNAIIWNGKYKYIIETVDEIDIRIDAINPIGSQNNTPTR